MSQSPPTPDSKIVKANARAGLWLFAVYLVVYGGFVAVSAFAPGLMATESLGGLNVATLYGLALIAAAFILALVYMTVCRKDEPQ